MKNWTYNELITCISNNFQSQIEQGLPISQAIGLVLEDFWFYPENENVIENLIDIIEIIKLRIDNLGIAYSKSIELYERQLNLLTDELLKTQLTNEEEILLKQSITDLNEKLKNVKLIRN